MNNTTNIQLSNKILHLLNEENFKTCLIQSTTEYFPDFLKNQLNQYVDYYKKELYEEVDLVISSQDEKNDAVMLKISLLSNAIYKTVDLYYNGKFQEATQTFVKCLDDIFYKDIKII